jgi:hypothetical protein
MSFSTGMPLTAPYAGLPGGLAPMAGMGHLALRVRCKLRRRHSRLSPTQSVAQTQVAYTIVSSADPATPVPNVSLSTSQSRLAVGGQVTLNWSSQNAAACTASGGTGSDGWSGSLSAAGQMMVTESASGDYTYAITCSGAPPAASAQVHVEFTSASTAGGTKSGGGGPTVPRFVGGETGLRTQIKTNP